MSVVQPKEAPGLDQYSDLRCDCGNRTFLQMVGLRWRQGGGTTTTPGGYKCSACGQEADTAYLIKRLEVMLKKREVQAVQDELEQLERPAKINQNVRI